MTYYEWCEEYYNSGKSEHWRLGQAFVNDFFKTACKGSRELFHETDPVKANQMILDWLQDNHYDISELPRKIER